MDSHVGARCVQLCGNLRPYAARGAGYQYNSASEARFAVH
jgi:hypothetical protein